MTIGIQLRTLPQLDVLALLCGNEAVAMADIHAGSETGLLVDSFNEMLSQDDKSCGPGRAYHRSRSSSVVLRSVLSSRYFTITGA
jgi:hypothetical protein